MAVVKTYLGDLSMVSYTGLSTDTKPVDISAGARFLETDTGIESVYDGTTWVAITAEVTTVTQKRDDQMMIRISLGQILNELRKMNLQLSIVTDNEVVDNDLEVR